MTHVLLFFARKRVSYLLLHYWRSISALRWKWGEKSSLYDSAAWNNAFFIVDQVRQVQILKIFWVNWLWQSILCFFQNVMATPDLPCVGNAIFARRRFSRMQLFLYAVSWRRSSSPVNYVTKYGRLDLAPASCFADSLCRNLLLLQKHANEGFSGKISRTTGSHAGRWLHIFKISEALSELD